MSDTQPARPVVASPFLRILAFIYDGLLVSALIIVVGTILIVLGTSAQIAAQGDAGKLSEAYRYFVLFPSFVLVTWLFYGLFWRRTGQTLGMQTWRLKVIQPNGALLDWPLSLIRCMSACILPVSCALMGYLVHGTPLALLVSLIIGFLFNYLFALFNRRSLALHDILSGTVMVRLPPGPPSKLLQKIFRRKS
ncbi:MAG: RDD family protein [Pseudomonadota bacterium]|nr:RDD family protein [Pseudomonadota bacterium]